MALSLTNRDSNNTEPLYKNLLFTKQINKKIPTIGNWPCYICLQQNKNRFFKFAQCNHKFVCNGCCQDQLKVCLKEMKRPKCFVQKCNAGLQTGDDSAFQHFSSSQKQQWEQKKLLLKPYSEEGIIIRKCPEPDCTGFLLKKEPKSMMSTGQLQSFLNFYECYACKKKYCQKCFKPLHGLEKCKKQQIELPQQMKQCPKCEIVIEKQLGCNKVRCEACTYVFCFNCGAQWSQQHMNCQGTILQQIKNFFWGLRQRIYVCQDDNTVVY